MFNIMFHMVGGAYFCLSSFFSGNSGLNFSEIFPAWKNGGCVPGAFGEKLAYIFFSGNCGTKFAKIVRN